MLDATPKPHVFTTPLELPPTPVVRRQFFLPLDDAWMALFCGALSTLFLEDNWQESTGGVSVEDTIQAFLEIYTGSIDDFMIGSITATTRDPLPDYLLLCDGANYSGDDYPALYAVIGDEFKIGDGTFVVPNLQGRFIVGAKPEDDGDGVTYPVDVTGGSRVHTLTESELASHTHIQNSHNHTQNSHNHGEDSHLHGVPSVNNGAIGSNPILLRSNASAGISTNTTSTTATNQAATATNQAATATNQAAGGGQPHNNMPPYRGLHYVIVAK